MSLDRGARYRGRDSPTNGRGGISYFQAIFIGILQGITELFPVSSLGHSVIMPALFGWDQVVTQQSSSKSSFLAFLVGLHIATAIALIVYFRNDWTRIVRAFFHTLSTRRAETPDERLAWLLVIGTNPVGITGLLLERVLRVLSAKPLAASIFLTLNGVILFTGEYKLPDLVGPLDSGIRGQVLAGSVAAGLSAYLSVRFLMRWFETRTLKPSRSTSPPARLPRCASV